MMEDQNQIGPDSDPAVQPNVDGSETLSATPTDITVEETVHTDFDEKIEVDDEVEVPEEPKEV